MPSLGQKIRKAGINIRKPARPPLFWGGPGGDGSNAGVTQGLLAKWLTCRERTRLLLVEGLKPADNFNQRIEYGQMWHACEEALAANKPWIPALALYCKKLCERYRTQQDQVLHWMEVCKVQFPLYVKHWAKHPDVKDRQPLLQEETFDIPYKLPSGRTARLRGKWDSADLIGKGKAAGVYMQENKTKGDIKEEQIKRQLGFDLQTMFYMTALNMDGHSEACAGLKGVRYNVVRRPLSGGKGSIVRHKAKGSTPEETPEHFYARLGEVIAEDPGNFFMRWTVGLTKQDIQKFETQFLIPCLEQFCSWWEWIAAAPEDPWRECEHGIHFRSPFYYNVLLEGGSSDLDAYLESGSELGLQRATTLFPELENGT